MKKNSKHCCVLCHKINTIFINFFKGDTEEYIKARQENVNKTVIIGLSVVGAIVIFFILDIIFLMKSNCGFLAFMKKYCDKEKSNLSEFKK